MNQEYKKHCSHCGAELGYRTAFCASCGNTNDLHTIDENPSFEKRTDDDNRYLEFNKESNQNMFVNYDFPKDNYTPRENLSAFQPQRSRINYADTEEPVPWYDSPFWDVPIPTDVLIQRGGCILLVINLISGYGFGDCDRVRGRWGLILFWIPGISLILYFIFRWLFSYFEA